EAGKDAPAKRLVGAVDHIEKMPAFAFGGFGGGNAVIVMGGGDEGAMQAFGGAIKTHTMTMRIDGGQIQLGGGDDAQNPQDPDAKKPIATARVLADEEGNLVVDRIMPGAQSYAAWDAMPMLRFAEKAKPKAPKQPKKKGADNSDF
ncbi:hypothetical protein HQ560_08015, partial [bacterium]|nr:hypothetical protein [bacterium]